MWCQVASEGGQGSCRGLKTTLDSDSRVDRSEQLLPVSPFSSLYAIIIGLLCIAYPKKPESWFEPEVYKLSKAHGPRGSIYTNYYP